jgi:hypothetical protein
MAVYGGKLIAIFVAIRLNVIWQIVAYAASQLYCASQHFLTKTVLK